MGRTSLHAHGPNRAAMGAPFEAHNTSCTSMRSHSMLAQTSQAEESAAAIEIGHAPLYLFAECCNSTALLRSAIA